MGRRIPLNSKVVVQKIFYKGKNNKKIKISLDNCCIQKENRAKTATPVSIKGVVQELFYKGKNNKNNKIRLDLIRSPLKCRRN